MTNEGLNRVAKLFLSDLDKITYTLDGAQKEKAIENSQIDNNKLTVTIAISKTEMGTFDNFKLIGKTGTIYSNKILNFTKGTDEITIDFNYMFISEVN